MTAVTILPGRAYVARVGHEILCRRRRLAAMPGYRDPGGPRIWEQAHNDEWTAVDLMAAFMAAGSGFIITEQRRRPLGYEATCFCGSPIIHQPRGIPCELVPPWVGCRCNGCVLNVAPMGRPRIYCQDKCKQRMRKAVNRARRRAEGKATRSVDEIADPIAELFVSVYPKARNG